MLKVTKKVFAHHTSFQNTRGASAGLKTRHCKSRKSGVTVIWRLGTDVTEKNYVLCKKWRKLLIEQLEYPDTIERLGLL